MLKKSKSLRSSSLGIYDDNGVIRQRAEASEVKYLTQQQVIERDNFIFLELSEKKKVLMDRVRELRLDTAKLRSTSSNPVGYLPGTFLPWLVSLVDEVTLFKILKTLRTWRSN